MFKIRQKKAENNTKTNKQTAKTSTNEIKEK